MDKKTIIIVVILGAIIIFYYPILQFLGLYEPPRPSSPGTAPDSTAAVDSSAPVPVIKPEAVQEVTVKPQPVAEIPADTVGADTIAVETEFYRILLSTRGGGPVSIQLKEYTYIGGANVEMLPECEAATPNAVFAGGTFSTAALPFQASLAPGRYSVARETLPISFTYTNPGGGIIRKTYFFYPDQYHYDLTLTVEDTRALGFERSYTLWWNTPLGITESQARADYSAMQAVTMQGGSRATLDEFHDNQLAQSLDGYTEWVGVRNKFFSAILIPRSREAQAAVAEGSKQMLATPEGRIEQRRITAGAVMTFAGVETISDSFTVYAGPLDYLRMDDYGVDLEDMLDIGTMPFFGAILKPFAIAVMWLLPKLHDIVPNYGLVIILFAVLVKIITLPLSLKQFKSMQAMRDLAPKLEDLKKRYKDDNQGLQRETMKLYKEHGVNPMSGCLVMLPQMPLMIAMFRVFQATILLRHEPLFWFVTDLSRGASGLTDPYIILVVLMVVTQMLSSLLTMSGGGQQQKMLTYIFPIMLGFFLYSLPSGLIIYWTAFSVLAVVDWLVFRRNRAKNPQIKTA
ncbi:MAG TPA: membrane protein insertase YidC [candidate division Zixibacteria bacterium]|nr:membrane protein insertase YidC [candidate division Zixibacteria bacterium]MDD4917298.1 membrane protein insertase YidC [candidate division Zixibacteria bacterium]MDM7971554.1 membrane protein insertase YidC [candidate division Zixibacteria bacterium]HOD65452.1 membrane protein insertase YidC [candidate division Zixibacteria bacterium]HPM36772.1 membrane protein insertase YidC [candidate division Zixibacteria bacterium]